MKPSEKISYLARKAKNRLRVWKDRGRAWLDLPLADLIRRMGRPLPEALRHSYFRIASVRASKRYDPKPYPDPMVIFETAGLFRDPHLGWDGLVTGGFEMHDIKIPPADAERYHAVFIPALAGPLKEVLRHARSRRDDPVAISASR